MDEWKEVTMDEWKEFIKDLEAYEKAWNKAIVSTIKYGDNIKWVDNFGQLHLDYQLGEIWETEPDAGITQYGISIVLVGDDGDDIDVLWLDEKWNGVTLSFNVVNHKGEILGRVVLR